MRTFKKTNRFLILAALVVVVGGAWGILFQTNLMPDQRAAVTKSVQKLLATGRKGLIRGIVSGEDGFTALIDDQAVREGESIYGATVVKIYPDKVEFEKDATRWTQALNQIPGRQWQTQARVKEQAEAEARAQAEAEAKAKEEAEAKARAEAQAKAEAQKQAEAQARAAEEELARAREQAEAQARAEAQAKAKQEAETQAQAEAEAQAKARQEAEAKDKEQAEAEARAEAQAKAEAQKQAEAQAREEELVRAKEQAEAQVRAVKKEQADANADGSDVSGKPDGRTPIQSQADDDTQKRIAVLIGRLADREPSVRDSVVATLQHIGPPAVAPLIAAMQDQDWVIRQGAAQALGRIGDPQAVEPLIITLKDKNQWIRRYAAEALGLIGDQRAIEPLVAAMKDDNPGVQAAAAKALESIRGWSDASSRPGRSNGSTSAVIAKLLDFKIYIGAGIAALLLLGVLAKVMSKRRADRL